MGLADFATVKRSDAKNFPGPGQYQMKSCFGDTKGRTATIKHRHKEKPIQTGTSEDVGPCSYEIKSTLGDAPKYSLSGPHGSGGVGSSTGTNLGPAYSPRQNNMADAPGSPRYSMAFRHKTGAKPEDGPGPASVTLPSTLAKSSVTLGAKSESSMKPRNDNPGPGNYDVPRFGDNPPMKRITSESHTVAEERMSKPNPGPGTYNVDQHSIASKVTPREHEKHRKIPLFGSKSRPPVASPCGAPGPAAYQIEDNFSPRSSRTKGKTMGTKPVQSSELESIYPKPGPGEYKIPSLFDNSRGKGFSLSSRVPEAKSRVQVPGPGAYHIAQNSLAEEITKSPRGAKFNAHHKFNDGSVTSPRGGNTGSQAPGPGAYDPKPVVPKPPSFSMSSRDHRGDIFSETTGAPGPGTYNIKESTDRPGFTFYKGYFPPSKEEERDDAPPGPGAYDDEKGFHSTKSAKGTTFGVHPPQKSPRRRDEYY